MADSITSIKLFGYINKSRSQTFQNMIIVYSPPPYDEIGLPGTESSCTHFTRGGVLDISAHRKPFLQYRHREMPGQAGNDVNSWPGRKMMIDFSTSLEMPRVFPPKNPTFVKTLKP